MGVERKEDLKRSFWEKGEKILLMRWKVLPLHSALKKWVVLKNKNWLSGQQVKLAKAGFESGWKNINGGWFLFGFYFLWKQINEGGRKPDTESSLKVWKATAG